MNQVWSVSHVTYNGNACDDFSITVVPKTGALSNKFKRVLSADKHRTIECIATTSVDNLYISLDVVFASHEPSDELMLLTAKDHSADIKALIKNYSLLEELSCCACDVELDWSNAEVKDCLRGYEQYCKEDQL